MVKIFMNDGIVGKGFDGQPAVRFNESGTLATFRVGFSVYDKRVEGNTRWENIQCKALGDVAKRVASMKLGEKAHIALAGTFDFDTWEKDGQKRKTPVLIVEDIDYVSTRSNKDAKPAAAPATPAAPAAPGNDGGYVVVDDDDLPFN